MWYTWYFCNETINRWCERISKKYNAFAVRIEPDIETDDQVFRDVVTNLGYKIKDDAKDFKDEIQPRFVFRLDIKGKTEEEVMAGFHQNGDII